MLWDTHLHSDFSHDSKTSMETMISAARLQNLSGICFTEHLDMKIEKDSVFFPLNLNAYMKKCRQLSEKQDIPVCTGIEFSIHPTLSSHLQKLVDSHEFDFIIGSCHTIPKMNFGETEKDRRKAEDQMYADYLLTILESIKTFDGYDVCGHIDYVVRYGPNRNMYYSYEKFADIIDEILRIIIDRGKGIEVNTSGFRYGLGHTHPTEEIIKRYRELGGEIITIGSDGHAPEQIAYNFEKVPEILKEAGFKYFTVFRERRPEFVGLD